MSRELETISTYFWKGIKEVYIARSFCRNMLLWAQSTQPVQNDH